MISNSSDYFSNIAIHTIHQSKIAGASLCLIGMGLIGDVLCADNSCKAYFNTEIAADMSKGLQDRNQTNVNIVSQATSESQDIRRSGSL